jgi:hypothetical protein
MTVEIRGGRELARRLKKLNKRELEGALQKMGDHVKTETFIYPMPPKPTYSRTENLKDSWKVKTKRRDFAVQVSAGGADAPYARYVHGDKSEQAGFHRSYGWRSLKETAKKEMNKLVEIIKRDVDRILEGRK